jgi:hypothetical protein
MVGVSIEFQKFKIGYFLQFEGDIHAKKTTKNYAIRAYLEEYKCLLSA